MKRGGNVVAYGHQALTAWSERWGSLGAQSIGIFGRIVEEGAVAAACQPEGLHGDPTMAIQVNREVLYYIDRAVKALADHDEDMARAISGHYLAGYQPGRIAHEIGVSRRRAVDLLESGQAWVGAKLMLDLPKGLGWDEEDG